VNKVLPFLVTRFAASSSRLLYTFAKRLMFISIEKTRQGKFVCLTVMSLILQEKFKEKKPLVVTAAQNTLQTMYTAGCLDLVEIQSGTPHPTQLAFLHWLFTVQFAVCHLPENFRLLSWSNRLI
jgi:hypothetical protein